MSNKGKNVKVHYIGTLDDGSKFDSSYDRNSTLDFTCGAGQMIPGFDKAVETMEVGQTVNVRLEPKDAYGEADPNLIQSLPTAGNPQAEQLQVGMQIVVGLTNGGQAPARVVAKDDSTITLDLNHEMAGKALNFEITLVEVEG